MSKIGVQFGCIGERVNSSLIISNLWSHFKYLFTFGKDGNFSDFSKDKKGT